MATDEIKVEVHWCCHCRHNHCSIADLCSCNPATKYRSDMRHMSLFTLIVQFDWIHDAIL